MIGIRGFFIVALASCTLWAQETPKETPTPSEEEVAQEFDVSESQDTSEPSDSGSPNKDESWYMYWGIGVGHSTYSGTDKELVDRVRSSSGSRRVTLVTDLAGVYFPCKNKKLVWGGIINHMSDVYRDASGGAQFTQIQVGPSSMYFFGSNVGDGFFVRADLGYVHYSVTIDQGQLRSLYPNKSESGYGLLAGGGYALPLTTGETRLLFNLNGAFRRTKSNLAALGVSVGLLF